MMPDVRPLNLSTLLLFRSRFCLLLSLASFAVSIVLACRSLSFALFIALPLHSPRHTDFLTFTTPMCPTHPLSVHNTSPHSQMYV